MGPRVVIAPGSPTCTVCSVPARGAMASDMRGGLSCATHTTFTACAFCGCRRRSASAGWTDLGRPGLLRCELCAEDAVDHQDQVRVALRAVRRSLSRRGFVLPKPTRVLLVPAATLPQPDRQHALGATIVGYPGAAAGEVEAIHVVAGLPTVYFHRVVAHEFGHVWLAQRRAGALPHRLQEGLSELIAYAALRDVGAPFGPALRKQISLNPDAAYGGGFRQVRDAVRRHGLEPVLRSLVREGTLP